MADGTEGTTGAATEAPSELAQMLDLLTGDGEIVDQGKTTTEGSAEDSEAARKAAAEAAEDDAGDSDEGDEGSEATQSTAKRKLKVGDDEVDEDEVLEWKKGNLRQQDYTRKTQAVAERQKKLETEESSVLAEKERYATLVKQAEELLRGATAEPDWDKLRTTLKPAEFDEQWRAWQLHERRLTKVAEERQKAEAEVAKDREKQAQRRRETFQERLLEVVPEWKDEKILQADGPKIIAYAEKLGFTRQELQAIDRPELLRMLRDAAEMASLREQVAARRTQPKGKRAAESGALRPGSRNEQPLPKSAVERAAKRLRETGSEDAAAAFFRELL